MVFSQSSHEEEWPPFSGTGVLLLKVSRVQSFNGFASLPLFFFARFLLPRSYLYNFAKCLFCFSYYETESSKSKRVLETETATIYLSLRSLISDVPNISKQFLDSKNVAKHEVLLHILKGENWLSVSDIRRKTILPEMKFSKQSGKDRLC